MKNMVWGKLTSDSSGDSTVTCSPSVTGRLVKIEIENSSTAQPSDNWDLTVYTGTNGGNDDEELFVDETVSNSNTSKVVYYPVSKQSLNTDGSDLSFYQNPEVFQKKIKLIGANMGDTKTAIVKLIFTNY